MIMKYSGLYIFFFIFHLLLNIINYQYDVNYQQMNLREFIDH